MTGIDYRHIEFTHLGKGDETDYMTLREGQYHDLAIFLHISVIIIKTIHA